ncbi:MAG: GHKL domain-containing protein [Firmicutes bacterium]|nr:GHKL domain-containing protein [Bacillota bacterium]
MIDILTEILNGIFFYYPGDESIVVMYLVSDEIMRIINHFCFLWVAVFLMGSFPNRKRLIIWELVFWTYRAILTIINRRHFFMIIGPWRLFLWIPVLMFIYKDKSPRIPFQIALVTFGMLRLVEVLIAILLPVQSWDKLWKYGLTQEEITSISKLLIVLGITFILRRRHISFAWLKDNRPFRLALLGFCATLLCFYYMIRPGIEHFYTQSILLVASFGIFTVAFILIIWISDSTKKSRQIRDMQTRIQGMMINQQFDQTYVHETRRALKQLSVDRDNGFLQDLVMQSEDYETISRLPDSIKWIVLGYLEELQKADIKLQLECSGILNDWPYTETEMLTIVGNLMDNAIEAVKELEPERRWIKLRLEEDEFRQALQITNPWDSTTISKESLIHIGSTSKRGKHMGMGLPTVKRLVERKDDVFQLWSMERTFEVRVDHLF